MLSEQFTYDRSWESIEDMLDSAEKKMNRWINIYYEAKENNQKDLMREAARNKKALDGVVKTLRWCLGDKDVVHPLS